MGHWTWGNGHWVKGKGDWVRDMWGEILGNISNGNRRGIGRGSVMMHTSGITRS